MNGWDIAILAMAAAAVALALRHMLKNRKNGRCPGGCDCCCTPCKNKLDTNSNQ